MLLCLVNSLHVLHMRIHLTAPWPYQLNCRKAIWLCISQFTKRQSAMTASHSKSSMLPSFSIFICAMSCRTSLSVKTNLFPLSNDTMSNFFSLPDPIGSINANASCKSEKYKASTYEAQDSLQLQQN